MAKQAKMLNKDTEQSGSAFAQPTRLAEEDTRQRRIEALRRLRGIGWANDLEAMRLGSDDHYEK